MSVPLASMFTVPAHTAAIAQAALPTGHRSIPRQDPLGTVSTDAHFADLSPPLGHPAEAPWRFAWVPIRPCAEHRTERQAVVAVRGRRDGPEALG